MKPVLQALVLAERVFIEENTGKKVIAGTFHAVKFSRKPPIRKVDLPDGSTKLIARGGVGGSPYAYLSLTDVCNNTNLSIQYVYLTKNEVLFQTDIQINSNDRLCTIEVVLPLPPLPFKEAGIYAIEVIYEGEIIGSSRIKAEEVDL